MLLFIVLGLAASDMTVTVFGQAQDSFSKEEFLAIDMVIMNNQMSLETAILQNQQVIDKVETILSKAGVNDDTIEVSKFEIIPKYELIRKQNTFKGHEVTQRVSFQCSRKILGNGQLIDQLIEAGVLKVESINWAQTSAHEEEAIDNLYIAAVKNARENAEALCGQAGMTVKGVQQIEEIGDEEEEEQQDEEIIEQTATLEVKATFICGKDKPKKKGKEAKGEDL